MMGFEILIRISFLFHLKSSKPSLCILYSANALYDTQKMIQMAKLKKSYLVNLIEDLLEMSMPSKINPPFKMWLRNWKLLIATS